MDDWKHFYPTRDVADLPSAVEVIVGELGLQIKFLLVLIEGGLPCSAFCAEGTGNLSAHCNALRGCVFLAQQCAASITSCHLLIVDK